MKRRLIVMLKFPRPGAVKTRLISAMGATRACEIYRTLVRQTLATVETYRRAAGIEVEVRMAGAPNQATAQLWLGDGWWVREQGGGDLGQRLHRAVEDAFSEGVDAVAVIGTDCPDLSPKILQMAFSALEKTDLVFGPAADGGYYLIGLRRWLPTLFAHIQWGTDQVLRQSLTAARRARASTMQLETLTDIDRPEDLLRWPSYSPPPLISGERISIVIPTHNEARLLPATLAAAKRGDPHEIIVVDGGSSDRTTAIAQSAGAIVVSTARGRAAQMNRGAAAATGELLLFLHADTLLPYGYRTHVGHILRKPNVVAGAFRFAIADPFPGSALIEHAANWRSRRWEMPYGDQAIFLRRRLFAEVGGFADVPLLEDCMLMRRLRREGRIEIAPAAARTSGRRWQRSGVWKTTLLNQLILAGYFAGLSPVRLAGWYASLAREPKAANPTTALTIAPPQPAAE